MAEGDPGTHRYKWFRPRQAARGGVPQTSVAGGKFGTVSLYNSSTGPTVLVVRDWVLYSSDSKAAIFGYNQGRLSGTNYPSVPMFPGDGARAGLVDYQAANAALTGDYQINTATGVPFFWSHDFPFAVIPPGWALFVSQKTAAKIIAEGFIWEED